MLDGLGLLLSVFLIGGPPVDADFNPVSGTQLPSGVLGTDPSHLENSIPLGLGDQTETIGL